MMKKLCYVVDPFSHLITVILTGIFFLLKISSKRLIYVMLDCANHCQWKPDYCGVLTTAGEGGSTKSVLRS